RALGRFSGAGLQAKLVKAPFDAVPLVGKVLAVVRFSVVNSNLDHGVADWTWTLNELLIFAVSAASTIFSTSPKGASRSERIESRRFGLAAALEVNSSCNRGRVIGKASR